MRAQDLSSPFFSVVGSVALVVAGLVWAGCDDGETLKAPVSDQNFDDGDEPATPGPIGAVDASTVDAEVACSSDVDCPPKTPRCFFPLADGCAARGVCLPYVAPAGCASARFCPCGGGGGVTACAPEGFSPIPVAPGAICPGELDAASDALATDAPPG